MDMQPGQLIIPHGDEPDSGNTQPPAGNTPTEPAHRSDEQTLSPVPTSTPPAEPANPPTPQPFTQAPAPTGPSQGQNNSAQLAPAVSQTGWGIADDNYEAPDTNSTSLPADLSWTAAEFTAHQKSASWYALVIGSGALLAGVYYWIASDAIFTGVILLVVVMAVIYASHKPRSEAYHLSPQGVQIGNRVYGFHQFKNFSVTDDGSVASVIFAPLGRVSLPITISVPPDVEDKVLNYLSLFLPFEEHRGDAVDGLLRRIKF